MIRMATVMRTSSGYHSHRSGEQVKLDFDRSFVFVFSFRVARRQTGDVSDVRNASKFIEAHDLVATFWSSACIRSSTIHINSIKLKKKCANERTNERKSEDENNTRRFAPVKLTFTFFTVFSCCFLSNFEAHVWETERRESNSQVHLQKQHDVKGNICLYTCLDRDQKHGKREKSKTTTLTMMMKRRKIFSEELRVFSLRFFLLFFFLFWFFSSLRSLSLSFSNRRNSQRIYRHQMFLFHSYSDWFFFFASLLSTLLHSVRSIFVLDDWPILADCIHCRTRHATPIVGKSRPWSVCFVHLSFLNEHTVEW